MNACPLCGSDDLFAFLERRGVPVHQNLPLSTRVAALATPRGDLRLVCCRRCGFVANAAFRAELLNYGEQYENDQTWSPRFDAHVNGLVDRLLAAGIRNKSVVEVGCGRGYFLQRLCARGESHGVGFDPSYKGADVSADGRVKFVRKFYGPSHADVRPDAVVCRHVIEHISDPLALVRDVRATLGSGSHALVAFETPTIEWILDGLVIQDLFYEHCSYFSPTTLAYAFRRSGFRTLTVDQVFGDQYIWLEAVPDEAPQPNLEPDRASAGAAVARAARYASEEGARLGRLRTRLEKLHARGPVAVWGGGAKGVTFLNLLDPAAELVDCVVDINPRKQGMFVPCTGHPIVGVEDLGKRKIAEVVVMNANYKDEIEASIGAAGSDARVHLEDGS